MMLSKQVFAKFVIMGLSLQNASGMHLKGKRVVEVVHEPVGSYVAQTNDFDPKWDLYNATGRKLAYAMVYYCEEGYEPKKVKAELQKQIKIAMKTQNFDRVDEMITALSKYGTHKHTVFKAMRHFDEMNEVKGWGTYDTFQEFYDAFEFC